MTSRVTFRFKSATASETVAFEGAFISVAELKREIVDRKGLTRDHAAELLLSEAQTGRGAWAGGARGGAERGSLTRLLPPPPRPRQSGRTTRNSSSATRPSSCAACRAARGAR